MLNKYDNLYGRKVKIIPPCDITSLKCGFNDSMTEMMNKSDQFYIISHHDSGSPVVTINEWSWRVEDLILAEPDNISVFTIHYPNQPVILNLEILDI